MSAAPLVRRRWLIGVLLFLATVLNYVDRQVFSILAPDLQQDIGWSELDYSRIVSLRTRSRCSRPAVCSIESARRWGSRGRWCSGRLQRLVTHSHARHSASGSRGSHSV
jgi:hypothetical protein